MTEISADFNSLADDLETNRSAVENQKDVLIADLYDLPAWEQEKYVHDRLASLITYSGESSYNQTLYSALCQQETVCAGYAKAFQYLMTSLGCDVITAKELHRTVLQRMLPGWHMPGILSVWMAAM